MSLTSESKEIKYVSHYSFYFVFCRFLVQIILLTFFFFFPMLLMQTPKLYHIPTISFISVSEAKSLCDFTTFTSSAKTHYESCWIQIPRPHSWIRRHREFMCNFWVSVSWSRILVHSPLFFFLFGGVFRRPRNSEVIFSRNFRRRRRRCMGNRLKRLWGFAPKWVFIFFFLPLSFQNIAILSLDYVIAYSNGGFFQVFQLALRVMFDLCLMSIKRISFFGPFD